MRLDAFLSAHGSSRADLVATLLRETQGPDDAPLFLSGSLVEGLGNHRSDVDAYLVSATGAGEHAAFGDVILLELSDIIVDLEVVAPARLDALLDRLAAFPSSAPRDPRRAAVAFSPGETKLLHNLRVAEPVRGASRLVDLRSRLDVRALARIGLDLASVMLDAIHVDVLGFIEAGDDASARLQLRAFASQLAAALLAALGDTGLAEKWRTRRLALAASARGSLALPGGLTIARTVSRLAELDYTIAMQPPPSVLPQLVRLSHAIIPWAQERFLSGRPLDEAAPPALEQPPIEIDADATALPPLAVDCRLQRDGRGLWLGSIGSPRQLYINELAHELLLRFDGCTSRSQAATRLQQLTPAAPDELERCIGDFHAVLQANCLLEPPPIARTDA